VWLYCDYCEKKAVRRPKELKAMGILPRPLKTSTATEKKIEYQYQAIIQMVMGVTPSQAKATIRDIIEEARKESPKEGLSELPKSMGDFLLQRESKDETIKSILARKRNEGVRDQDIRWWFNMDDLERRIILKIDDTSRRSLFGKLREEGLSEEEAAKGVRKGCPFFIDPNDTRCTAGQDRPLPYELKDRTSRYVAKRTQTDPETFKKEIEQSSSFNAWVRQEVKKGNI